MPQFPSKEHAKEFPLHNMQEILSLSELESVGQNLVSAKSNDRMQFNKSIRQKRINEFAVDNSPIPLRYLHATIDRRKAPPSHDGQYKIANKYVREFPSIVKSSGRGLLLWGNVGSGKTHMACAIGNALLKDGWTALYVTVDEIVAAIGASKAFINKQNQSDIMNRFSVPDILIIDEIGRKTPTESERNILSSVIHMRESNLRPIIGISNLPPHHLRSMISEMAMSRLTGHGSEIIRFEQEDMRSIAGASKQIKGVIVPCFDEGDGDLGIESLDSFLAI